MAVSASRSLLRGRSPILRGSEVFRNTSAGRGAVVISFPGYIPLSHSQLSPADAIRSTNATTAPRIADVKVRIDWAMLTFFFVNSASANW